MAIFVQDTMAGANWRELSARNGETGATWARHPAMASSNGRMYIYGGRVHNGSSAAGGSSYYSLYYASGVPDSADYAVECDLVIISSVPSLNIGPALRVSTSADTYYAAYYQGGQVSLIKRLAGVNTTIGTWVSTLSSGATYRLRLEAVGTAITVDVDGVERISATDGAITTAGRVGVRAGGVENQDEGIQLDNLVATDAAPAAVPRVQVIGIVGL